MKKYYLITFIFSFLIFYFFYKSSEAIYITKENINLFLNTLLPSLFPYMFLVLLFVNFKCHLIIAYFIQYISIPIFNISGKSFSIILIGIIGGYPLVALLAKEIINEDNKNELNKLVPLFSFPSLAFLNNIILNNTNTKFMIYYLIASFLILLLFKDKEKKEYISLKEISNEFKNNKQSYINTFSSTIFKSLNNLGIIFSNLLFFSLFKTLFTFKNEKINYLFLSLFEFSKSSIYLSTNLNNKIDIAILGSCLLFGGLSIIMQIYTIYSNTLLNFKTYLKYRIYLILIVILLIYIY